MSTHREISPESIARRRPPTLRRVLVTWTTIQILLILVLVILLIPQVGAPSGFGTTAVLLGVLVALSLNASTRAAKNKLAAKAPGLCPACEYALEVTTATPADEPVRCPECGHADTAGGVRMFWEVHVGKPSP
ncbi:MAG: hypothetical protein HEQ23_16165 [Tepidisphaera sp.]